MKTRPLLWFNWRKKQQILRSSVTGHGPRGLVVMSKEATIIFDHPVFVCVCVCVCVYVRSYKIFRYAVTTYYPLATK